MENAIYRVTVRCESPDGDAADHTILVLPDGAILTPDHDAEPWSHSLDIMEALGAEGDVSACAWWRKCEFIDPKDIGWSDGRIVVAFDTGGAQVLARYDVRDWEIETLGEWAIGARAAVERRLGLHHADNPRSWWSWARGQALPEELLAFLQRVPPEQLKRPGVNYTPITNVIALLKRDRDSLDDWLAQGQTWVSIDAWKHTGYTAEEAGAFTRAYDEASQRLHDRFGEPALAGMVFHPDVSLAASLQDAGIERDRALGLLRWAPQVIYPDWPGLAEKGMPEIPDDIPRTWVAEALMAIPAAGFMPGTDRGDFARRLVHDIPRRLAEDGDPQTWDSNWCWPEDFPLNEKEPETR